MCCKLTTPFQLKTECETLTVSKFCCKGLRFSFCVIFFFTLLKIFICVWVLNVLWLQCKSSPCLEFWCHVNHEAIPNTPVSVGKFWLSSWSQLTVDGSQLLWKPTRENCWWAVQRSLHFFHFLRIVFGQVSVDVSGPAKFRCPKNSKRKSRDNSVWKQGKPFTSSR